MLKQPADVAAAALTALTMDRTAEVHEVMMRPLQEPQ
jgi:hypothetical protein